MKKLSLFLVALGILMFCLFLAAPKAVGIGAASFASGDGCWKRDSVEASKDIAESPTASPERQEKKDYKTTRQQVFLVME